MLMRDKCIYAFIPELCPRALDQAGENPPVGLILCAEKGAAEAYYALDNLPNKVVAAEYRTISADETSIAEELRNWRDREIMPRT